MQLDELLEELSAELREPVSIDDRRLRLLAYSTHEQAVDPVRERSIMARSASDQVAHWLRAQGIERATDVLRIAANHDLGLDARVCLPLRRNETLLGYLWVVIGERELTDQQLATLERYASQAAELIWQRRFESDLRRAQATSALTELLAGESTRARSIAARELRESLSLSERERCAILLCECPNHSAAEVADALRRHRRDGTIASLPNDGGRQLISLATLGGGERPRHLADLALTAEATRACASAAFTELTLAGDQLALAEEGLLASVATGGGPLATTVEELGSGPLIARLWNASGRPPIPPQLTELLAARDGRELAETLLAVLDADVEMAALAVKLNLHRATLYRRIARAESLTGLRIAAGDERLQLHLALKLWQLGDAVAGAATERRGVLKVAGSPRFTVNSL